MNRRAFIGLGLMGSTALAIPLARRAYARPVDRGVRIMSEGSEWLESRSVPVAGQDMHMLVSSRPPMEDGPPIVLVHGLALSGQYMVPVAEALAPRYEIYAPDLPGFGDSGKPDRVLDVAGLAESLARWLDAVEIGSAVFLGNSFGCQIIAQFAARHPDRVHATVLQGPTTPPEERNWFWQFVRWRQNAPNNPPMMGEVADIDYGKCGFVRALKTFEFSLRDRVEDNLPAISAPSLVIRGSEDPICSRQWAESVAALLPDGTLSIMPDAAHTLVFTHPEEMARSVTAFLEG